MRRTIALRLATLLVIGSMTAALIGCGKSQQPEPGKNETPEQQQQRKDKAGD